MLRVISDHRLVARIAPARAAGGAELERFLDVYCRVPETHADYLEVVGIKRLLGLYEY